MARIRARLRPCPATTSQLSPRRFHQANPPGCKLPQWIQRPTSCLTQAKFADNVPRAVRAPVVKISLRLWRPPMFAPPVVSRWSVVFCLLVVSSLKLMSHAQSPQDVWTWHNDNNRTGLQSHETMLKATGTGHVSQTNFGLLWQWQAQGWVFAQPLAIAGVQTPYTGCQPCDLVFIATEKDKIYAFNAAAPSPTPAVWSLDLASYLHGQPW